MFKRTFLDIGTRIFCWNSLSESNFQKPVSSVLQLWWSLSVTMAGFRGWSMWMVTNSLVWYYLDQNSTQSSYSRHKFRPISAEPYPVSHNQHIWRYKWHILNACHGKGSNSWFFYVFNKKYKDYCVTFFLKLNSPGELKKIWMVRGFCFNIL